MACHATHPDLMPSRADLARNFEQFRRDQLVSGACLGARLR
jgi:hypothetical protein